MPEEVGATEWLATLSVGKVVFGAFVLTALRLILVPVKAPMVRPLLELIESVLIAGVLVFLIVRPFFLQAFFIPSESMEPTLLGHTAGDPPSDSANDHIFVWKPGYRFGQPRAGDIVVFRGERSADHGYGQRDASVLIKRLVAVGPDTIEIRRTEGGEKRVYRNGQPLHEPYILEPMRDIPAGPFGSLYALDGPLELQPGEVFVLGDNRNNSNDSRFWGPLPADHILGRAICIFWPPSRIRILR